MSQPTPPSCTHRYPAIQSALLRGGILDVRFVRGWYVAVLHQSARPFRVEASFDDVGKALASIEETLPHHRSVGVGDEGTGDDRRS